MLKAIFTALMLIITAAGTVTAVPGGKEKSPDELVYIRETFYAGVEDEEKTDELMAYIESEYSENTETYPAPILAYYGAGEALYAKHSINPVSKVVYLTSGIDMISEALEEKPQNLELRFLRFSILHHLPEILGYSNETYEDAGVIYTLMTNNDDFDLPASLVEGIREFMIESERLTDEQTSRLRALSFAIEE